MMSLRTEILTKVHIPMYIKVDGHQIAKMITVTAESQGPKVEPDRNEIDFGQIEVLKDHYEKLRIRNQSEIPAEYTAFTKNQNSVFKIIQRYGKLERQEEREIEVVCHSDDATK